MTDEKELIEIAKTGILHLLAVRFARHMEWQQWRKNPKGTPLKEQREHMAGHKIIERLLKPTVKHHQLSVEVERNKEMRVDNPYFREGMTEEIIVKAIEELIAEHKIAKPQNIVASISDRDDDIESAQESGSPTVKKDWHVAPHIGYVITDHGLEHAKRLKFTPEVGAFSRIRSSPSMNAVKEPQKGR